MSVTVNVIRLTDTRQKLMFINWDGPDPNDYTEITYNGETYQVVEYGRTGNDWLIIDAPKNFTSLGRIVLGGSDPLPPGTFMELVYNTTLSSGTTINLPLAGTVDVTVYWGDGTSTDYTTPSVKSKTYATEGTYTVQITGSLTAFGYGISASSAIPAAKLVSCNSYGNLGITNLQGAFRGANNLTSAPSRLPEGTTTTSAMFFGCSSFNQSVSLYDTSLVTDMSSMFNACALFNQSVANFDTSNVTNMLSMFRDCVSFNGDGVSSFDLSSLNAFNRLNFFAIGCTFTTENYDAILTQWNADKAAYRTDLSPNFGSSTYTATAARAGLISHGWTITDGGEA